MSVSEPGKIITPWAESGLKNPIPPAANPATGRAGFDQGFSAINMTAKEAGGIPPFGQDFNGIFYDVTNILRYMQAGGQPTFDAALATAIGGYPKGAMVLGSDGVTLWQSKVDSNSTNPNADPTDWGTFDIGLKADLAAPDGASLVGYSFNGAAYPVRTVLSKLRDSAVNIEDFGAVGDGVTDDTAAFVAANATLPEHSYLALKAGKNYLISGVTFTKGISMGCPAGQATITSNSGCAWVVDAEYLNVTVENLILIPRLVPDRNIPTTAISIELVTKNYGGSGYSRVINTRVRRNGALAYYNGIRMKNCPSIIDRCDVSLASSTSALAYAGDVDAWAENSGAGVLLDSATYAFVHETKSYYGQHGFRVIGQIEDSHFVGCMALSNRICYLYENLIAPANEHRIARSHGVAYVKGIDIGMAGSIGRIGFCSVSECSIMVPPECTVTGVIYLGGLFEGANIDAFQAYRSSSLGSSDKAIYLPTSGSFGARRAIIDGLHCYGVKTGVYIDTAERVNIANVNMLQMNMVGASTAVYEYGPNATGIVSSAYGFPDAENIFTGRLSCGVISATTSIGLKTANTVTANGVDKFRITDAAGNFRFESANSAGVLQYNAGIDQGGPFRAKSIYPLVDGTYYLGSGELRWNTVFATSATINTSDERHKPIIQAIPDTLLDAWAEVDWGNRYKLDDAIVLKGENGARWHFGLIAQWVEAVFKAHGIDGFTLGLLCFDEWGEQEEIIEAVPAIMNDEGVVIEPGYTYVAQQARDAGSRYGIRYEEALALEAALQRRERKRDREAFEVFKSEVLVRLQKLEA